MFEHGADLIVFGDIARKQKHFGPCGFGFRANRARRLGAASIIQRDVKSGSGQMEHSGAADSRCSARDERAFAPIHARSSMVAFSLLKRMTAPLQIR
jgi:hypothetical protein